MKRWKYTANEGEDQVSQQVPIYLNMQAPTSNETWNPQGSIRVLDNKIFFYGSIDQVAALDLNRTLIDLDVKLQNIKNTLGDDFNPVCHLHIASDGGEVYPAFAIVDTIRNMKSTVYTYVDGYAASAATFISLMGDRRIIGKHSHILIHQISGGMYGKFSELEDEIYNITNLMKILKSFYKEHTKLPVKKIDELLKKDIWLSAEECLQYGLVDEII